MYLRIYSILPNAIKMAFRNQLEYLDLNVDYKKFIGFLFVMATALAIATTIDAYWLFGINYLVAFVLSFNFFLGLAYLLISLAADSRGKLADEVLPDALQLISSNIKAGMTTERSILISARPEFGPLEKELKRVSTKIMTGMPIEAALLEMPHKIKSKAVESTMWLLSKGINSGGQISDLLFQLAANLREQNNLQQEVKANVSIYILMIFVSGAIGGPMLYGVSSFIVEIMTSQRGLIPQVDIPAGAALSGVGGIITGIINAPPSSITAEFVIFFTIVMLFVTSIFSAAVIGIIAGGKEKHGTKYVPVMLAVSFFLFFLVRDVLKGMFGKLLLG